jgi:hypothetical protein
MDDGPLITPMHLAVAYLTLKNLIPYLARRGAVMLDADNDSMRRVLAQYLRIFAWGGLHGIFAIVVDQGPITSYLFNFYMSDFEWVFDRATEVLLFVRRVGPASISSRWTLAFENLMAWSVVFMGYFSSAIVLRSLMFLYSAWTVYLGWLDLVLEPWQHLFVSWGSAFGIYGLLQLCYEKGVFSRMASIVWAGFVPLARAIMKYILSTFDGQARTSR